MGDRLSGMAWSRRTRSSFRLRTPPRHVGIFVWIARLVLALSLLSAIAVGVVVGLVAYYSRDLPDVKSLRNRVEPQTTRVFDREGRVIGEIFIERRTVVPIGRIPRILVLSVLAAEDADFYLHEGFDYAGLLRAVVRGILAGGRFRGTSTITQQLVKNMLLTPERSFSRKIRELILAYRIEQEFTKEEILELYLNHINFGHGRYGVQEASRFYFGKNVWELNLAEAALLAGIPQSPTRLSPRTNPEAAKKRRAFVLKQLEEKRETHWPDLSLEAIRAASEAPIHLAPPPEVEQVAPEAVEIARRWLVEQVGSEAVSRGGYRIELTIDADLQRIGREALRNGLRAYDQVHRLVPPFRRPELRRGQRPRPIERVPELRVGGSYEAVVIARDDSSGLITLDVGGHRGVASMDDVERWNPKGLPPTRFIEEGARVRVSVLALPNEREADESEPPPARVRMEIGPQGALVAIDPQNREVLAMVGGYDAEPGFNRATQALRQPGSTFKPIVYALAIQSRRYTPATIVLDEPGVWGAWQPKNFDGDTYRGPIRLREALAVSSNLVAVRVAEDLGIDQVVEFASRLGLWPRPATSNPPPDLSIALGSREVRPIDLVNAYATFDAGGIWEPWHI
ncbi:MAG: transglycosylase domain-containing protein, partial [Sandaracinaceae bacterium]|nr:transglycosylase domain-containing protein [Sandaracinaceae bacterium]